MCIHLFSQQFSNDYSIPGKAYGWGMGSNHQLGNGDENDVHEPKLVSTAPIQDYKIIKVCSGAQHTVFLAQKKTSHLTNELVYYR